MSVNTVTVSGNITRNPELRTTQSGTKVLQIGIAYNEPVRDASTGEWTTRPNFFDAALFGSRAEKLFPYLAKGAKVCLVGKLRQRSWEHEGQKRSKVEIVVDDLEFMSARKDGEAAPAPAPTEPAAADLYEDEIPF